MFGKKKVTKEEKFENVVETAGLTGLLTEASTKLFKRLHTSKKGVGVMETANIISGSERNCLRTIVAQNSVIKDQNDLIIQLLAQIADNTKQKDETESGE